MESFCKITINLSLFKTSQKRRKMLKILFRNILDLGFKQLFPFYITIHMFDTRPIDGTKRVKTVRNPFSHKKNLLYFES